MVAPTMPVAYSAPARVGVAGGWWLTSIKASAKTAHRLALHASGSRTCTTLCGRTLTRPEQVTAASGWVDVCAACRTKAARCPNPDEPAAAAVQPSAPPPTQRQTSTGARTAAQENTAAARLRRRVAFRRTHDHSDRAHGYVQRQYGLDDDAQRAAALRPDPSHDEGGATRPG